MGNWLSRRNFSAYGPFLLGEERGKFFHFLLLSILLVPGVKPYIFHIVVDLRGSCSFCQHMRL